MRFGVEVGLLLRIAFMTTAIPFYVLSLAYFLTAVETPPACLILWRGCPQPTSAKLATGQIWVHPKFFGERAPAIAGLSPAAGFGFRAC